MNLVCYVSEEERGKKKDMYDVPFGWTMMNSKVGKCFNLIFGFCQVWVTTLLDLSEFMLSINTIIIFLALLSLNLSSYNILIFKIEEMIQGRIKLKVFSDV